MGNTLIFDGFPSIKKVEAFSEAVTTTLPPYRAYVVDRTRVYASREDDRTPVVVSVRRLINEKGDIDYDAEVALEKLAAAFGGHVAAT